MAFSGAGGLILVERSIPSARRSLSGALQPEKRNNARIYSILLLLSIPNFVVAVHLTVVLYTSRWFPLATSYGITPDRRPSHVVRASAPTCGLALPPIWVSSYRQRDTVGISRCEDAHVTMEDWRLARIPYVARSVSAPLHVSSFPRAWYCTSLQQLQIPTLH